MASLVVVDQLDEMSCKQSLELELCRHVTGCLNLTKPQVHEEATIVLPSLLSPVVWRKHGYSLEDVEKTVEKFPVSHLWALVMAEGLTTKHKRLGHTAAACRDKLLAHFSQQTGLGSRSVLSQTTSHVPPIASHIVPPDLFRLIAQQLCDNEHLAFTCVFGLDAGSYYVPLRREDPLAILMARICSRSVFQAIFSRTRLESRPIVWVNRVPMVVLEEAFLVRES